MPNRAVLRRAVLAALPLVAACSGFQAHESCEEGETLPCESPCGPGLLTCEGGSFGACRLVDEPECLPGQYGTCELEAGAPPGLWLCSDRCGVGPCIPLCIPGETFPCEAECGPGERRCEDDGSWGDCLEYVVPECRPNELTLCRTEDAVGHARCGPDCVFGPCDPEAPCLPGETVDCAGCATQSCLADSTFGPCEPDPLATCSPGETRDCEGVCGPGVVLCTDRCEWSACMEMMPAECHPGQRQICPTSLYCGVAYRICGPNCNWMACVEVGL